MKRFIFVVLIVFSFVSVSFGDIVETKSLPEKIRLLGYPENISLTLASLVEKKSISGNWDVSNGTKYDAAVGNDFFNPNGSTISWQGNFIFRAEVYKVEDYILYKLTNRGKEVFFRIGPVPERKIVSQPAQVKEVPKTTLVEQKPVIISSTATPLPTTPLKKEKLENVEKPVEAYMLKGLHTEELKNIKATAIDFPILGTGWINDGIGKYYSFETKEGEAVQRFMTRNLWRAVVADSSGNYEVLPGIKRRCDRVHILYPGAGKDDLLGKNKYLVSGNGKKVLLADGRQIRDFDFEKFQEDETYRIEFLKKYPSEIRAEELLDISPGSKFGEEYVRLLKEQFPNDFYVKGERVSFSSDIQTLRRINGEMSNAKYGHRALKNGALPSLSVSTVMFPPFELGRMAFAALVSIPSGPLNGSYEGGSFSGEEIGSTIDLCVLQVLRDYEKQ